MCACDRVFWFWFSCFGLVWVVCCSVVLWCSVLRLVCDGLLLVCVCARRWFVMYVMLCYAMLCYVMLCYVLCVMRRFLGVVCVVVGV